MFPSTSGCDPPSLLQGRSSHTLFTTAEPEPRLSVCGGFNGSNLASCLVLNKETGTWDGNRLGSLPQPRSWHTAVTLKIIGNYLIGGLGHSNSKRTTDYLALGSQNWVSGPQVPVEMWSPCSVVISETSFLVIYGNNIREYQVDIENPTSDDGWQEATKWPQLQTARYWWPGCAKIAMKIVIAGGYSGSTPLRSTEVVDLETRTIQYAGDLNTARRSSHILTISTDGSEKTFAFGGSDYDGSAIYYDSVEELDPDTMTWNTTPAKLVQKRSKFGAVALPRSLVCQA